MQVTSACVSPRVNTTEPCVLGSTPVSVQIGLTSSNLRPSRRTFRSRTSSRSTFSFSSLKMWLASAFRWLRPSPSGSEARNSLEHLVHARVVLDLVANAHRLAKRGVHLLLDFAVEGGGDLLLLDLHLLLAHGGLQALDAVDDLLDGGVRGFERRHDLCLAHFLRSGLHHHDAVACAGDDQVEQAGLPLLVGRVHDELAVHETDANAGDGLLDRDAREGQRRGRACDREHVRIVLRVRRHQQRDDLRLIRPPGREERTDRAIDQAARQGFLVRRLAFTLEEPAGDASGRVGVLAVVDRQGEEINPLAGAGRTAGGDEDHGVARTDDDRTVGLLGEFAGLD